MNYRKLKQFLKLLIAALLFLFCCYGFHKASVSYRNSKSLYYEAVFPDPEEINDILETIRGDQPYPYISAPYHVTVQYMPEHGHPEFYGETVQIHIISYLNDRVPDDNGQLTANEGFKVELLSDNDKLQELLDDISKVYHITGSFEEAAKYTNQLNFDNGIELDYYITGTYGAMLKDRSVIYLNNF